MSEREDLVAGGSPDAMEVTVRAVICAGSALGEQDRQVDLQMLSK